MFVIFSNHIFQIIGSCGQSRLNGMAEKQGSRETRTENTSTAPPGKTATEDSVVGRKTATDGALMVRLYYHVVVKV